MQGPGVWVSTERGATESPIGTSVSSSLDMLCIYTLIVFKSLSTFSFASKMHRVISII